MVQPKREGSSLAPHDGSVRDSPQRGDAPADAGRAGDSALSALARALADGGGSRSRVDGRRDRRMAGARLQPACGQPAPSGTRRHRGRLAAGSHRAAGGRAVHGRGGRELRLRAGRAPCRHQRAAGAGADRRGLRRFVRAGAVRPRGDRLPGAHPALRDLPARRACPSRGRRYEPLRRQSRFEGSFRQRRAVALRAIAEGRPAGDDEAVASLARDGLVAVGGDGTAALPE